jgi:branched-chain amino acid transport system permease protein
VYASKLGFIGPQQFDFNVSVFVLCMIILGGMGTIRGVIVGAIVLYVMQSYVLTQLPSILKNFGEENNIEFFVKTDFSGLRYLIYGIALVAMMLLRPEGLLPNERRRAELHPDQPEQGRRESETELYDVKTEQQQAPDTRGGEG